MCGIAGFFDLRRRASAKVVSDIASAMANSVEYRGPDEVDVWCDAESGIALGHRRLSIIDLSPAGHQPMHSSDGRYVIAYNGEVYNTEELRPELKAAGANFRGHSDTEIILEGFAAWGVCRTLQRLAGMFALVLWDKKLRRLWLVRDRIGIKPLYWSYTDGRLLFGSELKALRTHPEARFSIDRDAITAYLRFNYVPAPLTVYAGVQKLMPGHCLSMAAGETEPCIKPYWSLDAAVQAGRDEPFSGNENEAAAHLESLLRLVTKQHMLADVPLGAFLSGGTDSSTVVALMQAQSNRPIKTFSIGFMEQSYNEAAHAQAVAKHLGTDHTEHYVRPSEARDVIPQLPHYYDEPFADSSQIPTYLVSKLARQQVTVAMSGDGGDELFGGYTRYHTARLFERYVARLPRVVRQLGAHALRGIPPRVLDQLMRIVPLRYRPSHPGDRLHKLAEVLNENEEGIYRRLVSQWWQPEHVTGTREPPSLIWDARVPMQVPDFVDRMQYLDTLTYLPDDILTKLDRASMAVSLESRVPLLDHRVVEFAWSLPQSMKIKGSNGKWILKQVLHRYVPQHLVERPKTGFGIPIGDWLRGPLRDWAEALLAPQRLSADGLLQPAPVRELWREHLEGRRNGQYPLWTVLMLQAWRARWS